jgi:hypothetical protein
MKKLIILLFLSLIILGSNTIVYDSLEGFEEHTYSTTIFLAEYYEDRGCYWFEIGYIDVNKKEKIDNFSIYPMDDKNLKTVLDSRYYEIIITEYSMVGVDVPRKRYFVKTSKTKQIKFTIK